MVEVLLFTLGFSSVISAFEIVSTGKRTKSDKLKREAEKITKVKL